MILIAAAGILGSVCSLAALLPYGWLVALLGMPIGGSLAAVAAACLIAYKRARTPRPSPKGILDPVQNLDDGARHA